MLRKQISETHDKLIEMMKDFYELFYNEETGEFENPYTYNIKEKLSLRHKTWNTTRVDILHPLNAEIKKITDKEEEQRKEDD